MKNFIIMQFRIVQVLFFVLIATIKAYGQSGTIEGAVKDKLTGEYLEGAAIMVQNSSLGTITNASGNYTLIGVPAGKQVIGVFFLRYEIEWKSQ
jgi:energy-converting hydrogenase Eha subunit B